MLSSLILRKTFSLLIYTLILFMLSFYRQDASLSVSVFILLLGYLVIIGIEYAIQAYKNYTYEQQNGVFNLGAFMVSLLILVIARFVFNAGLVLGGLPSADIDMILTWFSLPLYYLMLKYDFLPLIENNKK